MLWRVAFFTLKNKNTRFRKPKRPQIARSYLPLTFYVNHFIIKNEEWGKVVDSATK